MSLFSFVINKIVGKPDVYSCSNYLFIGPHPDDIELGTGSFVYRLRKLGKKVSFLICTDGRYGSAYLKDKSEEDIVQIRKQEAINSANFLGVDNVFFLNLKDGGFYSDEELCSGIASVIGKVKPDMILTVDPNVKNECHTDHIRVGIAVKRLAQQCSSPQIMAKFGTSATDLKLLGLFFTSKANVKLKSKKSEFNIKTKAILTHKSQFPVQERLTINMLKYLKIKRILGHEEELCVLKKLTMHVFPEADI